MTRLTRALVPALFVGAMAGCGGGGGFNPGPGTGGGGGSISWTRTANPGANERVEVLYTAPDGVVYAGSQGGLYITPDNGQTWSTVNGVAPGTPRSFAVNAAGEVLAGIDTLAYRHAGSSWQQATGISSTLKVSAFTLDSTGGVVAVTAWSGEVYRSTDGGASYLKISDNPAQGMPGTVGALWTVATGPDGALYTGGEVSAGLFRSTDNGYTWQQFGLSAAEGYSGNLRGIVFNRQGEMIVNRMYQGRALQRRSGGNWVSASQGLPVNDLVQDIVMSTSGRLYTGTLRSINLGTSYSGQVFTSADDGKSWSLASQGMPNVGVSHLTLTKSGYLIAACADGAMYRSMAPVP